MSGLFKLPDVETLRLCSLLATTAFALVFAVVWRGQRRNDYMLHWSASALLYGATIVAFGPAAVSPLILTTGLYAILALTNVLLVTGIRRLEGGNPFQWWMPVSILGAALGHAVPLLLIETGWLPRDSVVGRIGDTAGLALSIAMCGGVMLAGRISGATWGQRIAGVAMLAYLPGYALSLAGELGAFQRLNLLALLSLLSDQALLSILNIGLLAIPIERAQQQLREAALRDPLTGAWNRAGLEACKKRLLAPGAAAIAIDVDHFKAVNDRHGHAAGDEILAAIGREAGRLAADHDGALARTGGDEFVILLPAGGEDPRLLAERLRVRFQASMPALPAWSVSMGVASVAAGERDFKPALRRADDSLYLAKACGRDRVAA